jgi:hypothetical protein
MNTTRLAYLSNYRNWLVPVICVRVQNKRTHGFAG